MLELFLKFVIIWVSIDIVIFIAWWYLRNSVQPHHPEWWRRVVVDEDPDYFP